ncbi:MAG: hypothetical protein K6G50_03170 [bacterium]|nr:hypothetical protein [bacterium]
MSTPGNGTSTWRLIAGLIAGALTGTAMGGGVDIIGSQIGILSSVLAIIVGFAATYLLKEGSPRREKPSNLGSLALIIVLACYVVVGRFIINMTDKAYIAMYAAAGLVMLWLVFTSIAESSLLTAFGIGGFCCGFLGVIAAAIMPGQFAALFSQLSLSEEKTIVYTSIGLICAIPGAFAAVAGRMSGWGLAEHTAEEVWCFMPDGRMYSRKDSH